MQGGPLLLGLLLSFAIPYLYRNQYAGRAQAQKSEIKIVDEKGLKKGLAEFKNKIVVVNFWATWCVPCREEFPQLVEFAKKFRNKGIVVVTASVDDQESLNAVKDFLRQQKADMPSFLIHAPDMDTFINAIDQQWTGAVPATFVYDRKGNLAKRIIGGSTLKEFESAVQPLLK
jgi:thiol-disulfide isomerase/thioredoxin